MAVQYFRKQGHQTWNDWAKLQGLTFDGTTFFKNGAPVGKVHQGELMTCSVDLPNAAAA